MFKPWIHLCVAAAVLLAVAASSPAQQPGLAVGHAVEVKPKSAWGSFTDSVSTTFKKGVSAVSKPFESSTPKVDTSDPTSLSAKADPSAELYVAVARTREENGDWRGAEEHYKKALDTAPKHLGATLGYGRLLDRQGRIEEALHCYHRAIKNYPRDATPLNHLALCLASHGLPDRAIPYLERAVQLAPREPVYRNNLAMILVEQGKNEAAFRHLVAVQDEATAYYNLGYLLQKRGDRDAARKHFAIALRCNPELDDAKAWLAHCERPTSEPRRAPAQVAARPERNTAAESSPVAGAPFGCDTRPVPTQAAVPPRGAYYSPTPNGAAQSPAGPPHSVPSTGAPPVPTSGLHQPAGATAPVYQTNPLRRDSQWPQPPPRTPPPAFSWAATGDARNANLPPGGVGPLPCATSVTPGATGFAGAVGPSASAAPLPNSRQIPAAAEYGAPNTNVVYPLPPVVESSPAARQ